jgi:NAD(P)-dependent dehydrogenase (short-subunit alcohol dehydrogenase family)
MVSSSRSVLLIGNSDGIGLALGKRLLADGWTVTGVSRRAVELEGAYEHAIVDVGTAAYPAALAALHARRGPFDACVYCAGIGEPFDDGELARASEVMRVNLLGVVETAAVVIPPMIERGRGHFVALSSIGDTTSAAAPTYAASKAGLSAWLGGMALALRPKGVKITNIRFGFVDTKMAKSKVKPMMIGVDRAVSVIVRCLERKPARRTYPRAMQALVALASLLTTIRLWLL